MMIRRGNFFKNSFIESHWELVKECIFDFYIDKKGKKYFEMIEKNWMQFDLKSYREFFDFGGFLENHWKLVKECIFDFYVDKNGKKYFGIIEKNVLENWIWFDLKSYREFFDFREFLEDIWIWIDKKILFLTAMFK